MLLRDEERAEALQGLPHWSLDADARAIRRTFRFADFGQAFGFIAQVALAAERADHHPDWRNVWNRVDVTLTTHDAGGLTDKDVDLARVIDAIAATCAPART